MHRPLVAVCWVQVAVAIAYVLLSFYTHFARPTLQLDFSRARGEVLDVAAGGAAGRAGLRRGDRIVALNSSPVAPGYSPLYLARAGQPIPVELVRHGRRMTTEIVPVTVERARREALQRGPGGVVWAIASYMHIPIHVWMLVLGVGVLALRPNDADARLAALTLVYWAGGSFFYDAPSIGAILAPVAYPWRVMFFVVDAFFIAAFFGACLHFAMIFPTERAARLWRPYELVAYLAAMPVFLEAARNGIRRAGSPPAPVAPAGTSIYLILGPALLFVALVVLAVRFRRVSDLNARRRLQILFLALLPGAVAFAISVLLNRLEGAVWAQVGRVTNQVGTILGSGIFAYAVVRHRIFHVRLLVRRSLQYALARGTLLTLMVLPAILLAAFLYANRRQSLAVLLTGTPAVYLLIILPLILVVRYRRTLLDWLDRRYFREQYDARRLLLHVVSMVRDGSDSLALSRVALDEIERALHPKHCSLWQLDAEMGVYVRGIYRGAGSAQAPPLPANSALVTLLTTDAEPIDLHNRQTRALTGRLPVAERLWLGQSVAYLLVPLLFEQRLVGMMVLGERLSEEPYSSEDRELLRTLAAQLAFTLDYSRLKASPSLVWSPSAMTVTTSIDLMRLCPTCGRCYEATHVKCEVDGRPLVGEEGVPRQIDEKYTITRILGRGGMGSVYLATQTRLNRPVAIKVLLTHLVGSTTMQGRFEREARIIARLRHPGIVTIHDFGVLATGHAYLVMEYLEGYTLRKTIMEGAQSPERMLELIAPVGDAIDSAHRAGVVHRDLKPENIMIVRDHEGLDMPRVLDFGLAKISTSGADAEATLVQSGHSAGIVGTLMYMAPEALSGRIADPRSDQYSLGLITYELLAGTHPFGGAKDLASVVKGHTDVPPPPLPDSVPPPVAAAVLRALAKKPDARFPSVADFVVGIRG
jgi:hypothetical protein